MPDLYIPSNDTTSKLNSLVQGFWMEIDDEGIVVILFKLEPSIITSLINGCKFELIIRNPKLATRSVTLYVYDHPKDPIWITWQDFGQEDEIFKGFDDVTIELLKSTTVRVAYFDLQSIPVFTTTLKKASNFTDFKTWALKVFQSTDPVEPVDDGYYVPENEDKGFKVEIENRDCSNDDKLTIHAPFQDVEWGEKVDKSGYNFDDFQKDGKHGYSQELSIKRFLASFYEPNEELFISPMKLDENELIDFIIHYKKATLLVESKFVLSSKKTKLNSAIAKAIKQLNEAAKTIQTNPELIENKNEIVNKIAKTDVTIRLCLYNDSQSIHEIKLGNTIKSFDKSELPIFMSVTTFFQLISDIKLKSGANYKYNIIQNLIWMYSTFIEDTDQKILIIREYKMKIIE